MNQAQLRTSWKYAHGLYLSRPIYKYMLDIILRSKSENEYIKDLFESNFELSF